MRHKFLFTATIASLLGLSVSCNNIVTDKNQTMVAENKAMVSLSTGETARTIIPTNLTEEDVIKVELTAQQLGADEKYSAYIFSDGATSIVWNAETQAGITKNALTVMKNDTILLDYGTYNFTLKFFTGAEDTRLSQQATLSDFNVDFSTKAIDFGTAVYTDEGDVTITLTWAADSDNTNRIGSIQTKLYKAEENGTIGNEITSPAITTTEPASSADSDGNKTYSTISSAKAVPNGTYYIKFQIIDTDNTTVLNTITDIIKVHGYKTEKTISLDLAQINLLYNVTYNPNGGTWSDSTKESKTLRRNAYKSLILPTKDDITIENSVFAGWYEKDSDGNPVLDKKGNIATITTISATSDSINTAKDYTLYALWKAKSALDITITVNTSDITVTKEVSDTTITFTADEAYESYVWKIDGQAQTTETPHILLLDVSDWTTGVYEVELIATKTNAEKTTTEYYSYTAQIVR